MELARSALVMMLLLFATLLMSGAEATALITLHNACPYNVWPGIQAGSGQPLPESGGFLLLSGQTATVTPPAGWSGRFWGRTGCSFDGTGTGNCTTGDCGGRQACQGAGGTPPATLAEFTLGDKDFYDVSLVDGYNLAMAVAPAGGSGPNCSVIGCTSDLLSDGGCPAALQETSAAAHAGNGGQVVACRSACDVFGSPEFCCTGAFASPQTCKPSSYSEVFKEACPTAYSYAYDDASSTFTCVGASSYTVTFCPAAAT